jgi:DNA repair photolyase
MAQWLNVEVKKDIMQKLEYEIKEENSFFRGKEILQSFWTDPYNSLDVELQLTRRALMIMKDNGVIPVILTKGGLKSTRDFDLLHGGKYGTTLTFTNDEEAREWEPFAPSPSERIKALQIANDKGIYIFVSIEPVIYPEQSLELIEKTHTFVNEYKIGVLNYNKRAKAIDYRRFYSRVVELLEKHNKKYYIKKDLEAFAA